MSDIFSTQLLNYAQFMLKDIFCVPQYKASLFFPCSFRDTAKSRKVKFAAMHLILLNWLEPFCPLSSFIEVRDTGERIAQLTNLKYIMFQHI